MDKLYIDFTGGNYESWFYSEGNRYKGKKGTLQEIEAWARKNGMKIIMVEVNP